MFRCLLFFCALSALAPDGWAQGASTPLRPEDTPAQPADAPAEDAPAPPAGPPVANWFEAQVELHRRGYSCGSIDGVRGAQTAEALQAFQRNEGLPPTGNLDTATRAVLLLTAEPLTTHTFTAAELAGLEPAATTWLEKSQRPALTHASALELAGELSRTNPKLLRTLNPGCNWDDLLPGATISMPAVAPFTSPLKVARIHIRLAEKVLEATTEEGQIVLHCPVSIARNIEKRPVGELKVTVVIPNPDYTFDPAVFPESAEAQTLGRKLILPPGPNNPVGLAWIGLDRPGYGMHGTPDPEKVGRTESHGCFRLANWDAVALLALVKVGTPVMVEP
ncbi:MAG TPA: L,D-transpeptidase family protein [Lacunisphaera sp.]|jgi:lipoprotein-anchoring transpeptidase ErfK/SrfK|nr:murein L,D-transpeptidase [Lacunisphaera sp.]HQY06081.1 L,D-transpeptidase family protein [Lacunisphaera sp.]